MSSERSRGDGIPTESRFGDTMGLPSLDNTVRGTTRGDGEEVENGEEHVIELILVFILVTELAASSLPLG